MIWRNRSGVVCFAGNEKASAFFYGIFACIIDKGNLPVYAGAYGQAAAGVCCVFDACTQSGKTGGKLDLFDNLIGSRTSLAFFAG